MEEDYRLKMAVISGASRALRYKDKNPKATFEEIIQKITDEVEKILEEIDAEEE